MKVLVALHDKAGRVVTREELVDRCWDGRIVGEDVLNRCISLLRGLATRSGGFAIETIPRSGYRLLEMNPPVAVKAHQRRNRWAAICMGTMMGLAALAGWFFVDRPAGGQGAPPTPKISVAPFGIKANDPLVRQVADAAPLSVSRMLAESGYAIVHQGTPAAPESDSSDFVLTGTVRREPNSVDATVQLISSADGSVAYSHDFRAPQAAAGDLPDRIGATVVTELGWTGAAMMLDPQEHLSPQIRSQMMSATTLIIEEDDSLRPYQLFKQAAKLAPNSAIAQLTLAILTGTGVSSIPLAERSEAVVRGRQASDRAVTLAPEFGDVYLTWCMLHSRVRMTECEAHVRHALDVDSRSSFVPGYFSFLLHDAGLIDQALQLARQSLANDPYRPAKLEQMIRMLELSGNASEAELLYKRAIRIWPDSKGMRGNLVAGLAERGDYAAIAALADPANGGLDINPPAFTRLLTAEQRHDLPGAERACGTHGLSNFTLGLCMNILADLGNRNRAFAIAMDLYPASQAPRGEDADRYWLDHPDGFDLAFLSGPAGKTMRDDPRFVALAAKLGLLDFWRRGHLPDFCTQAHEPVCVRVMQRSG